MRQAVTARGLSSSTPAPSPSKRPKRAAPQLPPQELARLADKQLNHLRRLLAGTEHPYPGPCGLDEPVSAVVKFFKEAHSAWAAVSLLSSSCLCFFSLFFSCGQLFLGLRGLQCGVGLSCLLVNSAPPEQYYHNSTLSKVSLRILVTSVNDVAFGGMDR